MTNSFQVELLNDNLIIDEDNSFALPEWTFSVFPDKLYSVSARSQALFTETDYMKRIKGGPLITKIVGDMDLKRNGNLTQNMFFYSAHDVTLTNVMRALEIQKQTSILPEYGATLIFELHSPSEISDWFVKVSELELHLLEWLQIIFFFSHFNSYCTTRAPKQENPYRLRYPIAPIHVRSTISLTFMQTVFL